MITTRFNLDYVVGNIVGWT